MEVDGVHTGCDACAPGVPAGHDARTLVHVTQQHAATTVAQGSDVIGAHYKAQVGARVGHAVRDVLHVCNVQHNAGYGMRQRIPKFPKTGSVIQLKVYSPPYKGLCYVSHVGKVK